MPAIRITVGAAADPSLSTVYTPLYKATRQARAFIAGEAKASAKEAAKAHKEGADAGAAAHVAAGRAAKGAADQAIEASKRRAKAEVDSIKTVQAARNEEHRQFLRELQEQERELRKMKQEKREREREEAKAAREKAKAQRVIDKGTKERADRLWDFGGDAAKTFTGLVGRGVGVAKEVTGGLGVDFSLGAATGRGVSLASAATRATTSAFAARGEVAGQADVNRTMQAIYAAGDLAKVDYGKLAAGLEDFVSKSSDLKTAKETLGELALIARATGTEVDDLLAASGDVAKTLDDTPDKGERLLNIMRLVAKQGAMGNVEIKQLATYMGKVTATSFMYEGGVDKNIGVLGALAQMSMKGGAATAADAVNAAQSFARDMIKESALKRFEAEGINVFANKEKTQIKGPEDIITQFLRKTGGNFADLAKLFQNEMSKKIILGFEAEYLRAGKGEAGIQAVSDTFKRFATSMSAQDIKSAAGLSMGTPEAKAQAFQNQLDRVASALSDRVLPRLEEAAPSALKIAENLGDAAAWAATNPGSAITAAIIASIAKAGIGTATNAAMEKFINGLAAKGIGGGIAIGAAALTIAAASIVLMKAAEEKKAGEKAQEERTAMGEVSLQQAEAEFRKTGTLSPETRRALIEQRAAVKNQIQAGELYDTSDQGVVHDFKRGVTSAIMGWTGQRSFEEQGADRAAAHSQGELWSQVKGIDALLSAVKGTLKVEGEVSIKGGIPAAPGVDGAGRTTGM